MLDPNLGLEIDLSDFKELKLLLARILKFQDYAEKRDAQYLGPIRVEKNCSQLDRF